jgi:transposase-like protein
MNKTQVITGTERRRRFNDEEKAKLVAEVADSTLTAVARKYGISPSLLYVWRKKFPPKSFALIEVQDQVVTQSSLAHSRQSASTPVSLIRVVVGGRLTVEFPPTVDPVAIARFVKALED